MNLHCDYSVMRELLTLFLLSSEFVSMNYDNYHDLYVNQKPNTLSKIIFLYICK